jgi:phage-related protein
MEALLKLRTSVEGGDAISGLGGKFQGLVNQAKGARDGLDQMSSGARTLLDPIRALVPAVSAVGLIGMAKNAIDSADALAKMSARTGVSVEMLDKLKQAANLSDTSIEGVGKGLTQLGKSLVAAQTGTGKQAEAFAALGISTTDANGKLRSTEEVMLDIANRFKDMPDGAEKATLAMDLMGRGGAELVPMLNMGGDAIDDFKSRISDDFASKAEEFNDKLTKIGERFGELGVKLAEGLMPALEGMADALLGLIDAFVALPAPIQLAFVAVVGFGPQLVALGNIFLGLITVVKSVGATFGALNLGAIVAGWLGAVVPALAAIVAAFKAFAIGALAVITGPVGLTVLAVAGIVAMAFAFREPIMDFFNWLGGAIGNGLNALWQWGEPIRQFWVGVWEAVKGVTVAFFDALVGIVSFGLEAAYAIVYQLLVQPWINLWDNVLREPVTAMLAWLTGIWSGVSQAFDQYVIEPISRAWNALIQLLPDAMTQAADFVLAVWTGLVDSVKGVINSLLRSVANAVNSVGSMVNQLIRAFNALPGPNIPLVPTFSVPQFAKGGVVDKATLAMIGEGGEREYIVPESKMAAASSRYLGGARGSAVIPSSSGGGGAVNSSQAPVINITTGPLMQFDGEEWVSRGDFEKGLQQVADAVLGRMRTPSARIALGRV